MRRNAWLCISLAAALVGSRAAQAQSFSLTPANSSAQIIPSPTAAAYTAGTSASTPSWTLVAQCPKSAGPSESRCPVSMASSAGTLVAVQVTVAPGSGAGCTGAGGTFTLQSTPTEILSVARGNGNSCTTTFTFAVTGLGLATYKSSATLATATFTRPVQITVTCLQSNGNAC